MGQRVMDTHTWFLLEGVTSINIIDSRELPIVTTSDAWKQQLESALETVEVLYTQNIRYVEDLNKLIACTDSMYDKLTKFLTPINNELIKFHVCMQISPSSHHICYSMK